MNPRFKRILSLLLVAALLAGFYVPSAQAASTGLTWKESDRKIEIEKINPVAEPETELRYQASDPVRVSIVLEDKPTIQAGFRTRNIVGNAEALAYGRGLRAKQDALAQAISTQVLDGRALDVAWNLTLAANLISATVPYGKIDAIAQVEGVKAVVIETSYQPCAVERVESAQPQMFASLTMTGSNLVWSSGYTGAGSRIAVVDTGTDTTHQSLNNGAFLYALTQNAAAKGMSYENYLASLDLLDAQEIAAALPYLNINDRISGLTAAKLYLNEKLPFAANYIDGNLVVDHMHDGQGEHGSHVAGIATGNRFIPSGSSYVDALETVNTAGAAPDAQLLTMKVFGNADGPYDSDYLAAVEDAIYLGCDSVNLSLGSSNPGVAYNEYFSDLLDYFTETDTVVVASAGNSFAWSWASLNGYSYYDDVVLDTVGAPGSHTNFFTVASVENDGGMGYVFQIAGQTILYQDGVYGYNSPLHSLDHSYDHTGTQYDYLFIDGMGFEEDYAGMDLYGKVVFCSRGNNSFSVKAETAMHLGAAAVVIYNNEPGLFGMDLSDYYSYVPCASISQEDANTIRDASTKRTTSGGLAYYTGKITILTETENVYFNSPYKTMSDFSSWGVPGDLSLKPEITAPGGNIYSIYGSTPNGGGSTSYEWMSGTSMAAPAITGVAALVAQYLEESGLAEQEGISARQLTQSLLMSTAEPLLEKDSGGNYYSLLKQGAGLVRVDRATTADSYILVDGQNDGKVKAELGDDPNRTGVYEFSFSINNMTGKDTVYTLRADAFCQDMFPIMEGSDVFLLDYWTTPLSAAATFTVNGVPVAQGSDLSAYDLNGDGAVNALDADYLLEYLVGNESTLHGTGDVSGDGTTSTYDAHVLLTQLNSSSGVTVPAYGSVTVKVRLALTASGKQMLEDNYPNGTFVEAFVYAEALADEEGLVGTVHSIPVLAFYGNWTDPNMFDRGNCGALRSETDSYMPYLYHENGLYGNSLTINYGDGREYYLGGNPYVDDEEYLPERIAFNSTTSSLVRQNFALLRNASEMQLQIANGATGQKYMNKLLGPVDSAFYFVNGGYWYYTQQNAYLGWDGTDAALNHLPDGTQVEVSLVAAPEYYRNADGSHDMDALGKGACLTTSFVIDNTYPEVTGMEQGESTLTVTGIDNRYVAAVMLTDAYGRNVFDKVSPNQTQINVPVTVELDLSQATGTDFLLIICDYAGNEMNYEITLTGLPEGEPPAPTTGTTLQAFIWDENSDMWVSEFDTSDLPNYTELHSQPLSVIVDSATIGQDGVIYGFDADTYGLYRFNASTYQPTLIGYSSVNYVDMAPAPHMPGNTLMAVYGINAILVDADTGEYYNYFDVFTENIVAVTYIGTNSDSDGYIDWYYLIGQSGNVYLYGFQKAPNKYYYLDGGVVTTLGFEFDTYDWNSAYYDGEYLYISAYQYYQNDVALWAVDTTDDSYPCYLMGTFPYNVYPVVGLMDMDADPGSRPLAAPANLERQAVVNTAPITPMEAELVNSKTSAATTSEGGLNAVAPQSSSEYEESTDKVTVTLTGVDTAPNGLMTVTYDASALTFTGISGVTEAFAYKLENGKLTVAFAAASPLAQDTAIATLTFQVTKPGEHTITVHHVEAQDGPSGKEEILTVSAGCDHNYQAVVTPPTCQEQGYTTYTCSICGDSYVDNYTDPVDHVYEDGHCKWCGEEECIVEWKSATTSLNGTIDLNIYVVLSENLVNDPDTCVRFMYAGKTVDVPIADAVISVSGGVTRYRFSCELYAKEVSETVTMQVLKDGQPVGNALNYSIVTYCMNRIQKSTNPKQVAICKALLNYATQAQISLNYNLGNLANAQLDEADKVLPENIDVSAYKTRITGSETGIKAKSATLMLEAEVFVRVYFTLEDGYDIEDFTFTIDGKEVEIQKNNTGWFIETDGIPAKDLDKMFKFSVGGLTVEYGALSYVDNKLASTKPDIVNMARAIYAYYAAAEALLG